MSCRGFTFESLQFIYTYFSVRSFLILHKLTPANCRLMCDMANDHTYVSHFMQDGQPKFVTIDAAMS